MSKFRKYAGIDVRRYVKQADGASYIPWATQLALAGRPTIQIVQVRGSGPVREIFGGGVVAADQLTEGGKRVQRTWLPVQGFKSEAVPFSEIHGRHLGDAISRVRARSIATVTGLGISLYTPCGGDGTHYVDVLGVLPDCNDLTKISPLIDEKRDDKTGRVVSRYLGWFNALAAARITDPDFCWEVLDFPHINRDTGEVIDLPAQKCPGVGWMVAVRVTWRDIEHTEWLPVMGFGRVATRNGDKNLDHQPLPQPDANDWHKAVMRCLAKAIAIATGYGLEMYADDVEDPFAREPEEQSGAERAESNRGAAKRPEVGQPLSQKHLDLIKVVRELVSKTGTSDAKALTFLRAASYETASLEDLERVADMLSRVRPAAAA